jgi:hypothetical protein
MEMLLSILSFSAPQDSTGRTDLQDKRNAAASERRGGGALRFERTGRERDKGYRF